MAVRQQNTAEQKKNKDSATKQASKKVNLLRHGFEASLGASASVIRLSCDFPVIGSSVSPEVNLRSSNCEWRHLCREMAALGQNGKNGDWYWPEHSIKEYGT